jgi:signal transduction histidine kinase/tetratricopeptide (TPR) repeat protein
MTTKISARIFQICFLIFYSTFCGFGQSDTALITKLLDRSVLKSNKNYSSVSSTLDSAYLLIKESNSIDHIVRYYNIKGSLFMNRNEFDSAIYYYRKGLYSYKDKISKKQEKSLSVNIGTCLIKLNQFDSVLYFLNRSLELSKAFQDTNTIANTYLETSHYYSRMANFDSSYFYCDKAVQLYTKLADTTGIILSNNALSLLYVKMGFYDKAIKKLKYIIHLDTLFDDYYVLTTAYLNLSDIYSRKLSKYDSAVYYLEKCVKESERKNDIYMLEATKVNMSNVLFSQDKYEDIVQLLLPNRESKYAVISVTSTINTGIAFSLLKDDSARYFLEKGNQIAKENGFIEYQSIALDNLYRYDSTQGDFKLAMEHYQEYIAIRDTLTNKEYRSLLANLENKFELDKERHEKKFWQMEAQVKEEKLENKALTNQLLIFVSIGLIAFILLLLHFRRKTRKLNNSLSTSNEELKQFNQDLKALNEMKTTLMSILSHDLKSSITPSNQLLHLLQESYDELPQAEIKNILRSAAQSSDNVSNLLDNLLQWTRLQFDKAGHQFQLEEIDLQKRIDEVLKVYTPMTVGNGIQIINKIHKSIFVYSQANIMDTILRNLLSNANKFTPSGGTITIDGGSIGDFYELIISDTGIGMKKEVKEQLFDFNSRYTSMGIHKETGNGLGLKLIYQMVKANKGSISVESEIGKGSRFIVTLPLYKNDPKKSKAAIDIA